MKHHAPLDGLRAIAVSAVITLHFYSFLLPGGFIGVDVFFVISGFLISSILLTEIQTVGRLNFGAFYMRRFLRLMPAFWLMLICTTALYVMNGNAQISRLEGAWTSAIYMMNWLLAFSSVPGRGSYLGHTWSLAAEEQFYFVWPLMLAGLSKIRSWAVVIIIGLAIASALWRTFLLQHGASWTRVYFGFDSHADSILIGCALGFIGVSPRLAKVANSTIALPVAILAVIFLEARYTSVHRLDVGITAGAICAAWIIVASYRDGYLKAFLSWGPLVYTGRISYGWYLWHYPILAIGGWAFGPHNHFIFAIISYAVAVVSFHFVERPVLSLRDRFRPTLQSEEAASKPALA